MLTAVVCPVGFDFHAAWFAVSVVAEAAPWPVFGVCYQTGSDGIAVDVSQLLYVLPVGEDVEVVVAGLPEVGSVSF